MSIEQDHGLTKCPNCKSSCEIAAVKFSFVQTTSMLFVCSSCGFAQVDTPSTSTNRPKVSPRMAMAFGLMMTASVVLYIVMRLSVFEHQTIQTGRLATVVEQSRSHPDVQTHQRF